MTTETDDLVKRLREPSFGHCNCETCKRVYEAADTIERLQRGLQERDARIAELEKELDYAAPKEKCARCGGEFRWYQMTPEEGDEWECLPCNARENARERAAMKKP